ncbi:MAG TPA: Ig-like domain-containing protein, partial [Candidatus Dormibacteraeota bacterium]|nr:Ig-like domain-containing protein [Candidatus Dormibacteraeota bacterium]
LAVSGVQPLALGFHAGNLEFATATDVQSGGQQRLASLSETATVADFSSAGDHLAYIGASGLHLVDLGTGRDVVVGPATGLGDWSPDGHQYAYPTETGVTVADTTTGAGAKLFDLAGVTGLSWSRGNQVLASTAGSLYLYNASDGIGLRKLADGSYGGPEWAPDRSGTFAYRQAGQVWVARLVGALAGTASPAAGPSQDDLVNAFMAARKNQLSDQAMSYLDSAGKDAFGKLTLIYTDPSAPLSRYYVLLSQPGRVVVRLVITSGSGQSAIDETLIIQRDASSRPWIHGVSEAPRNSFASGPEVVKVTVQNGQVQVSFDSDLDAASVRAGVSIKGVTSRATYDPAQKMVTLTVPGGLNPGQTYDLLVGTGLVDVQSRQAVPYDLQFTGD